MIATLLASILPGVLLPAFKSWVAARNAEAARIADERMEARRLRAQTTQMAMSHKVFWIGWIIFVFPLGVWWNAVLLDTVFMFSGNIPDLPPSVKPWAESIINSLFWGGGGVASAQLIAKAIGGRR